MKTYTLTLTEEQAEAVGYAISKALRPLKDSECWIDQDLARRLKDAAHELDTCPSQEMEAIA